MEKVNQRYIALTKALTTLKKALQLMQEPKYQEIQDTMRNSTIQCFEYSIDTFWKYLKVYLQEKENIDILSANPRETLREAVNANLMNKKEYETLLSALKHRNLTSHTYNEPLAEEIVGHIPKYYKNMTIILKKLSKP